MGLSGNPLWMREVNPEVDSSIGDRRSLASIFFMDQAPHNLGISLSTFGGDINSSITTSTFA
jgi:hypothetical protein